MPQHAHRWRLVRLCPLFPIALLTACMVEDPRGSGVVVLDERSAGSGVALEQHGVRQAVSSLPLLVDPEALIELRNGSMQRSFALEPGELARVRGEDLTVERMQLGIDVERDRLIVRAPGEEAVAIAEQISAEAIELEPGAFELRVANVFAHLAQLDAEHVREVLPIERSKRAETMLRAEVSKEGLPQLRDLDGPALIGASQTLAAIDLELDPVGIYDCEGAPLVLDASGRASGCAYGEGGSYALRGRTLTLETALGQRTFEVEEGGALVGAAGMRCALRGEGGVR